MTGHDPRGCRRRFDHDTFPLAARLPRGERDSVVREFSLLLDHISLHQNAGGDCVISGPRTNTLVNVPTSCPLPDGSVTSVPVNLTVEDCGGWAWSVPLGGSGLEIGHHPAA